MHWNWNSRSFLVATFVIIFENKIILTNYVCIAPLQSQLVQSCVRIFRNVRTLFMRLFMICLFPFNLIKTKQMPTTRRHHSTTHKFERTGRTGVLLKCYPNSGRLVVLCDRLLVHRILHTVHSKNTKQMEKYIFKLWWINIAANTNKTVRV